VTQLGPRPQVDLRQLMAQHSLSQAA
jgi:hypothetical protein